MRIYCDLLKQETLQAIASMLLVAALSLLLLESKGFSIASCPDMAKPGVRALVLGTRTQQKIDVWSTLKPKQPSLGPIEWLDPSECPALSLEFNYAALLLSKNANDFALLALDEKGRPAHALALDLDLKVIKPEFILKWVTQALQTKNQWSDIKAQITTTLTPRTKTRRPATDILKNFYQDRVIFYQNPEFTTAKRAPLVLAFDLVALLRIQHRSKSEGIGGLIKDLSIRLDKRLEYSKKNFELGGGRSTLSVSEAAAITFATAELFGADRTQKNKTLLEKSLGQLGEMLQQPALLSTIQSYAYFLAVGGLARAARALQNSKDLELANQLFVSKNPSASKRLLDHASYIFAALEIAEAKHDPVLLERASQSYHLAQQLFGTDGSPGYRDHISPSPLLGIATKTALDESWPSSNGLLIWSGLRLERFFPDIKNNRKIEDLEWLVASAYRHPGWQPITMLSVDIKTDKSPVVVQAPLKDNTNIDDLAIFDRVYAPNASLFFTKSKAKGSNSVFSHKFPLRKKTTYYVCFDGICRLPVWDIKEALVQASTFNPYTISRKHRQEK